MVIACSRVPVLIAEFCSFSCAHSIPLVLSRSPLLHTWLAICSKMFIGGLNWDTTDGTHISLVNLPPRSTKMRFLYAESLRNYFTQFGKVDACTIMRDAAGRSRCFAFLTFEDPASVNAVMVREHFLDGKIVCPSNS